MEPGADEIDKALIQLGLVGNSTSILDRDTTKWRTVQEATPSQEDQPAGSADNQPETLEEETKSTGWFFVFSRAC